MHVVIRADASLQIGTGHVMRCLTLAEMLRSSGSDVTFICRQHAGHLLGMIESAGHRAIALPVRGAPVHGGSAQVDSAGISPEEDAREVRAALEDMRGCDWLIVDHYQLDRRWESSLRTSTKKIMVIDDLANRPHDCDLLLDQNYYRDMQSRYDGLVPAHCGKLLGPRFALLRKQFREARQALRTRDGHIRRILIFMGGSDSVNVTAKAIKAVSSIGGEISLDVVIGGTNPHRAEVESLCASMPDAKVHVQVENMAELMARADLAIGAGGAATWERCSLGLPTITLVFAQNQLQTTLDLASIGVITSLGWIDQCSVGDIAAAIQIAMRSPQAMKDMSDKAMRLMEGSMSSAFSFAAEMALPA